MICNHHQYVDIVDTGAGTYQGTGVAVSAGGYLRCDNESFKDYYGNPVTIERLYTDINGVPNVYGRISGLATNKYVNSGNLKLRGQSETYWIPPHKYAEMLIPVDDLDAYVKANSGATLTLAQMGY